MYSKTKIKSVRVQHEGVHQLCIFDFGDSWQRGFIAASSVLGMKGKIYSFSSIHCSKLHEYSFDHLVMRWSNQKPPLALGREILGVRSAGPMQGTCHLSALYGVQERLLLPSWAQRTMHCTPNCFSPSDYDRSLSVNHFFFSFLVCVKQLKTNKQKSKLASA